MKAGSSVFRKKSHLIAFNFYILQMKQMHEAAKLKLGEERYQGHHIWKSRVEGNIISLYTMLYRCCYLSELVVHQHCCFSYQPKKPLKWLRVRNSFLLYWFSCCWLESDQFLHNICPWGFNLNNVSKILFPFVLQKKCKLLIFLVFHLKIFMSGD